FFNYYYFFVDQISFKFQVSTSNITITLYLDLNMKFRAHPTTFKQFVTCISDILILIQKVYFRKKIKRSKYSATFDGVAKTHMMASALTAYCLILSPLTTKTLFYKITTFSEKKQYYFPLKLKVKLSGCCLGCCSQPSAS
ncbi:DNA replication licensing factor Mcm6, partial [Frankliniella fusca]